MFSAAVRCGENSSSLRGLKFSLLITGSTVGKKVRLFYCNKSGREVDTIELFVAL